MESALTDEQTQRFCSQVHLGNTLPPPKAPPRSSIHVQEEQLDLYVSIKGRQRALEVSVSSEITVGEFLKQHINGELQENARPCVFYGEEVMHYNDKLADWGVIQNSKIKVCPREFGEVTVTIKLLGVQHPIQQFSADQTWKTLNIKEQVATFLHVQPYYLKLFMEGKEIKEDVSLADIGIYKSCTFLVQYCKPKGVQSNSLITPRDYSKYAIHRVELNDYILSFDTARNTKINLKPKSIHKIQAKSICRVILEDQFQKNVQIQCSEGVFFYTQDSKPVICKDRQANCLKIGDKIMASSQKFIKVTNIHFGIMDNHFKELTLIRLHNNSPYFINSVLMCPPLDVQVLFRDRKTLTSFDMHPSMSVANLKEKIQRKLRIEKKNQHLYIQNRQIILRDDISIQSIFEPNLIIQVSLKEDEVKSIIQSEKTVVICFDEAEKRINYQTVIGRTCGDIICKQFASKVKDFPYFGVLFQEQLVELDTCIQDIVPNHSQAFFSNNFTLTAIKFPERFKLSKAIRQGLVQPQQPRFLSKILSFLLFSELQNPTLTKYKQNYLFQEVKKVLKDLHQIKINDLALSQTFKFISQLIRFLKMQSNYTGECFRVMPRDRELEDVVQNSIINFRNFLSCCPQKKGLSRLVNRRSILLTIRSISGKVVKLDNSNFQIVFLPYTYFLVNRIATQGQIIHIWLIQMPTSMSFDRQLLIWVDDQPQNNQEYIPGLPQETELIQLTSTAVAKRWFQEFGWLANRRNLKIRVVTDMVRQEVNRQGQAFLNYWAGIDLIEYLFNERGFTTPVLIFCNNSKKGRENIVNRGVRSDRFHQVTNNKNELRQYINFQNNLNDFLQK